MRRIVIPHQLLGVRNDVAFEIKSLANRRHRRRGVADNHHAGGKIFAAGFGGMHDGVVKQREEIAFLGVRRVVAVEKDIADGRDFLLGDIPLDNL